MKGHEWPLFTGGFGQEVILYHFLSADDNSDMREAVPWEGDTVGDSF